MPHRSFAAPHVAVLAAFAMLGTAAAARAQVTDSVLDIRSAESVRAQYLADLDTVHTKIVALAKAIPADKYSWRPEAGVRSVSEALMHVASEWYFYAPQSVGGTPPAGFLKPGETVRTRLADLEKITDKNAVLAELDRAWAQTKSQVDAAQASTLTGRYKPWGVSLPQAAFLMSGDLHEHLGQLIAYARANGVTPPWSK